MDEQDNPRPSGDAASHLATEDLSPYSLDELAQRITLLKLEIIRVEEHRAKAASHRAQADALFGKPNK